MSCTACETFTHSVIIPDAYHVCYYCTTGSLTKSDAQEKSGIRCGHPVLSLVGLRRDWSYIVSHGKKKKRKQTKKQGNWGRQHLITGDQIWQSGQRAAQTGSVKHNTTTCFFTDERTCPYCLCTVGCGKNLNNVKFLTVLPISVCATRSPTPTT